MKPVILSGIQPSGGLHIGHYIGALRNWVSLQNDYECFFMIVDLHAITVKQDPQELRRRCFSMLAQYLALGLHPEKNTIFIQSQVPGHSMLAWILSCFTGMGQLSRMTQFKEKSQKHEKNINAGLFLYPVLMAADILLYRSSLVPVGEDQKQHLELARDLAQRFNAIYGDTFIIPEPYIPQTGSRIMSLTDPTQKMSKSDGNDKSCIFLLDSPAQIRQKFKSAVTDSGSEIIFDEQQKPGIANLLSILSSISGESMTHLIDHFSHKQYGHLKLETAEAVISLLEPFQKRYQELISDQAYLQAILEKSAQKANHRAAELLKKVHDVLGFVV